MYELNYDMICENFVPMLNYFFKNSDTFSLISNLKKPYTKIPPICEHDNIISAWNSCLISRIPNVKKWPGTETKSNHKIMLIYNSKKFRRTICDIPNFFLAVGQNLPEDICFYKNNIIWLYMVTHEKTAVLVSPSKSDIEFLTPYFRTRDYE